MNRKRGINKGVAIVLILCAVVVILSGVLLAAVALDELNGWSEETAEGWFDQNEGGEEKQLLYFQLLTDSFASYELNENRELYFVMDEYGQPYIVCMDKEDRAKYEDVYEYTYYSGEDDIPVSGRIEGYAMPIDEELKALAIECFNEIWGEEVVDEESFEDYFGSYYLDATYLPGNNDNMRSALMVSMFLLAAGFGILFWTIHARRRTVSEQRQQKEQSPSLAQRASMVQQMEHSADEAAAEKVSSSYGDYILNGEKNVPDYGVKEAAGPGSTLLGVVGALIGASAGGLLWILVYKAGYIAGICGYAAVFGADWGYWKLSRRRPKGGSFVFCVVVGMLMIVFANYLSYVWEIVSAANASGPGSADFGTVFRNLPGMMKAYDLWSSFLTDLVMGLLFSAMAVAGEIAKRRRKR